MNSKNLIYAALGVSLTSLSISVYFIAKIASIAKKLDTSIDDLSKDIEVEVPKKIVDEAIEKAVDRETTKAAVAAVKDITKTMNADIESTVAEVVAEEKKGLYDVVKAKLMEEVGEVDIEDLKDDVRKMATLKASQKFDGDLNDILVRYNAKLDSISTIYESIARNFGNKDRIILP